MIRFLKWLIPLLFLILSLIFYTAVHGHSFLGLVCLCIAGAILFFCLTDLLKGRLPRLCRGLNAAMALVLSVGIALFAVAEALVIHASRGSPHTPCAYILVLGAKVNGTAPSVTLSDRIDAAADYLTDNPAAIAVLTGGQGPDEGMSEAACMYRELTRRGIAGDRLWLEDKATSTWENLRFSLDIIEAKTGQRPKTVGLLSSEYHLYRAGLFAKACGTDAVGIPARTSRFSVAVNYFLREAAGVWHYIILGGQYHD